MHATRFLQLIHLLILQSLYHGQETYITKLHVMSKISNRFAVTHVTGEMENKEHKVTDTSIEIYLPQEAIVTNLNITVDDRQYIGVVVSKRKTTDTSVILPVLNFTSIRYRDSMVVYVPVTLKQMGYVTFDLTYHQLLRQRHGQYEQVIFLDSGHVIPELKVLVLINETLPILDVRGELSVPHESTNIDRIDSKMAHVSYIPASNQRHVKNALAPGGEKLYITYKIVPTRPPSELLVEGNHFVHWISPQNLPRLALHVVLLVDVSREVIGWKQDYILYGMKQIMKEMRPGYDRYDVMAFDNETRVATQDSRELRFPWIFRPLSDRRGRNFYTALKAAVEHLHITAHHGNSVPLIFVLTGGDPDIGVIDTEKILEMVKEENKRNFAIYTAGIGANMTLLEKLALAHHGNSKTIPENDQAQDTIGSFFRQVSAPVLHNVHVTYSPVGGFVSQTTKTSLKIFNEGEDIVIAGKLRKARQSKTPFCLKYTIRGSSVEGQYEQVNVVDLKDFVPVPYRGWRSRGRGVKTNSNQLERIWVYLMMKRLIQRHLVASSEQSRLSLQRYALKFARKHSLWTSMFHLSLVPVTPIEEEKEEIRKALTIIPKNAVKHCDPRYIQPGCPPPHGPFFYDHDTGFAGPRGFEVYSRMSNQPRTKVDYNPSKSCKTWQNSVQHHHYSASGYESYMGTQDHRHLYSPPSVVVPIGEGRYVCVSWNRTSNSQILLFSDKGSKVTGKLINGRLRKLKIKRNLRHHKTEIKLTVHHVELGNRVLNWNQNLHKHDVTLHDHIFTWNIGETVYRVHRTEHSLILEQRKRHKYSPWSSGLLAFTDGWVLKRHLLCIPSQSGGLQLLTTRKMRGGCHLVMDDGNSIYNYKLDSSMVKNLL